MKWSGDRFSGGEWDIDQLSRQALWVLLIVGSGLWLWQGWKQWQSAEVASRPAVPARSESSAESERPSSNRISRIDLDPFSGISSRR